ncbi:MAG: GntR family transcriptional regulator [Arcicella sp.]|jgi:GntR family transcriptional regulator/GntR family frlABCD operon transcriptional regulator|nr:GntR family transcriptional regulator [Arcicella sp.]
MKKHQYQTIYEDLKQQIQAGKFKEGELIPSENELCHLYQTTRMTIRQALSALVKEEYIIRRHGKGSIVKTQIRRLGLLTFKGFSEVVEGANTGLITEPIVEEFPKPFFFELSELEKQSGCITLKRLRFKEEEALMLENTFLPANLTKLLSDKLLEGSLFKSLKAWYNLEMLNLEQSIRAIEAPIEIAKSLQIKKGTPVIYIERKYITNQDNIFIYSALYCYTGKYALFNEV